MATSPVILRRDHCPGTANQRHQAAALDPIRHAVRPPDFDISSTLEP
ncbi:hypothetical protein [Streptomyces sp. NPDC002825]